MPPLRPQFGHRCPLASLCQPLFHPLKNTGQVAHLMPANMRGGPSQLLHKAVHVRSGYRRPLHSAGIPNPVRNEPNIPRVRDGWFPAQFLGQFQDMQEPAPQPLRTARARPTRAIPVSQFHRVGQPPHILVSQAPRSGWPAIRTPTRGPPPTQQLVERPLIHGNGRGRAVVGPLDHRLGEGLVGVARCDRAGQRGS